MKGPWTKVGQDPLLFEKELLPTGRIVKWVGNNGQVHDIRVKRPFLDKLVKDFNKLTSRGVRIPLYSTHVEHPDNERGLVKELLVKQNKRGRDSAYIRTRFHNEKYAEHGKNLDVSAGIPPSSTDGKGGVYVHALRHVALTSKPVVPGLEPFTYPIILSFDTPTGLLLAEGQPMNELIVQILTVLEITPPEGADEATMLQLILDAVTKLKAPPAAPPGAPGEGPAGGLNLSEDQIPGGLVKQFKNARELQIDSLVRDEIIDPATADDMRKDFLKPEAIRIDLSQDEESESEFDRQVRYLRRNKPLPRKGAKQGVKLSSDSEPVTVRIAREKRERLAKR